MKHEEQYISSLRRKGMLHGVIMRSPIPKGRIAAVEVPKQLKDTVIISSKDIPGSNSVKLMKDTMPLLANEEIFFIGQPILAVFAPSFEAAKLAAASIRIEFEAKPDLNKESFSKNLQKSASSSVSPGETGETGSADRADEDPVSSEEETDKVSGSAAAADAAAVHAYADASADASADAVLAENDGSSNVHVDETDGETDVETADETDAETADEGMYEETETHDAHHESSQPPYVSQKPHAEGPIFLERTSTRGDIDSVMQNAHSVFEHSYKYESGRKQFTAPTGALAEPDEDRVIIYASTQWPYHVRNTAASVCGIHKRKLVIYQCAYRPTHGEKLLYPSFYAALASLAAVKSGKPARLISQFPLFHPSIIIRRRTGVDEGGAPVGEDIQITADVGAFPIFVDELAAHIEAGVTGYLPLKASRVRIQAVHSNSPPKYYYNGFGYDIGLMSAETQGTFLVENLQMNPAQWRLNNYVKKELHLINGAKVKPASIQEMIESVSRRSDFHRKFAVNRINKLQRKHRSPFPGYLRGIGIASGFAPNGFSAKYPAEKNYSVSVRLDTNDEVTIFTSMNISGAAATWIDTVHDILGIPKASISIADGDIGTLPDSGPHILSRDIAVITPLIARCCESIRSQRFKDPLPIEAKRGYRPWGRKQKIPPPFSHLCWGSIVVELEVDSVTFLPEFRGIWCSLDCGKIYSREHLVTSLKSKLLQCVTDSVDGRIQPEFLPSIDLDIIEHSEGHPLSGTQTITGLFKAAFLSALSQAVDKQVTELPLSPQKVLNYLEEQ